jgi:hypothetical protein
MKTALRTTLFSLIALTGLFLSACATQTSATTSKADKLGQVTPFTINDKGTTYGIGLIIADALPEYDKSVALVHAEALQRGWIILSPEQTDELRRVLAANDSGHIVVITELLSDKGIPQPEEYALRMLGSGRESSTGVETEAVGFYSKGALTSPGLKYAFLIPAPKKGK